MQEQSTTHSKMMQQAWGDWVRKYDWSHFVTLTTSRPFSTERLKKCFCDEWIRFATKTAQCRVPYFLVIEGGALGDQAHLHATVAGTASVQCQRLARAWRHGRAEVAIYKPELGAAYYMAKEIGGRVLDYGVSNRLPPKLLSDGHAQKQYDNPTKKRRKA